MYLSSFIHREQLLHIVERSFWGRSEPDDALNLTRIFIADGYVLGETMGTLAADLLERFGDRKFRQLRIRSKGELRDALSNCSRHISPRVEYLLGCYRKNPEYFYYDTPVNGVLCIDDSGQLVATYRLKRPKRIAEKANRRIADWIFETVLEKARSLAKSRADAYGVPLELLQTPRELMVREFLDAEESIAGRFRDGTIRFDRSSITIKDVGGMKILGEEEEISEIERVLRHDPSMQVIEREDHSGSYEATSLILEIPWNREQVCRNYRDSGSWEKYLNRGIPESELKKGIEPFLEKAEPRIRIELILSTFEAMVESEIGTSIHEERIIAQRDIKPYKGYIPMNVEFLLEYLFALGFSPSVKIDALPIKLWGRYLPDTLVMYIRRLYSIPQCDMLY
ncbi:MAG: hypothetical protein AB9866_00665 [Syntrophobacteraceae bacterium]